MRLDFREVAEGDYNGTHFVVLVFDVLDDEGKVLREYRFHAPEWVFEMRAAEYQLDTADDALEMVLGEAVVLLDPTLKLADDGPVYGQPNASLAAVRRAHQTRCRRALNHYQVDSKACRAGLGPKFRFDRTRIDRFNADMTRSPFVHAGGRG